MICKYETYLNQSIWNQMYLYVIHLIILLNILGVMIDNKRFVLYCIVYPIHNGSCHKQHMINNDKLNHEKPQLQLWIDSLNEMFLSKWTAHEQWNITFILLKTRREEGHQFVNLLPDTCKICDYTVDYMCPTKTSKSPHAFAMCSIRTDLLKQENEKIDSL